MAAHTALARHASSTSLKLLLLLYDRTRHTPTPIQNSVHGCCIVTVLPFHTAGDVGDPVRPARANVDFAPHCRVPQVRHPCTSRYIAKYNDGWARNVATMRQDASSFEEERAGSRDKKRHSKGTLYARLQLDTSESHCTAGPVN